MRRAALCCQTLAKHDRDREDRYQKVAVPVSIFPILELFPQPSKALIGKHLITQPDIDPNVVTLT